MSCPKNCWTFKICFKLVDGDQILKNVENSGKGLFDLDSHHNYSLSFSSLF